MSNSNITGNELHRPSELLSVAQGLFESGNPCLLRPAILEAITCLEAYIQDVVFKALGNKLDPLLVKSLEDKTKTDFDSRLSVLTPIATGYPINKEDRLWADYKRARDIRHKVVHSGKRVTEEEAGFVLQTVHDWLAYLVSSVELEFALLELKKQVETKAPGIRNRQEAVNLVIEYFGQTRQAKSSTLPQSRTFDVSTIPVLVFEFGKYRVAVNVQLINRNRLAAIVAETNPQEKQGHRSRQHYLPQAFTHGAAIYFVRGERSGMPLDVQWIGESVATVFISC